PPGLVAALGGRAGTAAGARRGVRRGRSVRGARAPARRARAGALRTARRAAVARGSAAGGWRSQWPQYQSYVTRARHVEDEGTIGEQIVLGHDRREPDQVERVRGEAQERG